MTDDREFVQGSIEYLDARVSDLEATKVEDASLDGDLEMSIDRGATWEPAEWVGDVFMMTVDGVGLRPTRLARRTEPLDTTDLNSSRHPVWVQLTDNPEVPIILAGFLKVI